MAANPTAALDAILHSNTSVAGKIQPLTIARYAILELVKSPLLTGEAFTCERLIETVYLMSIPVRELAKYDSKNIDQVRADAFEWSESNVDPSELPKIVATLVSRIAEIARVAPENVSDKKKASDGLATAG